MAPEIVTFEEVGSGKATGRARDAERLRNDSRLASNPISLSFHPMTASAQRIVSEIEVAPEPAS